MIKLYTDGGCSGNHQKDYSKRSMVAVVVAESGQIVFEKTYQGGGSSNIAELLAIEGALMYAVDNNIPEIHINTDSQIAFFWFIARKLKKKKQNNFNKVAEVKESIERLKGLVKTSINHIPREINLAGHYIENKYSL